MSRGKGSQSMVEVSCAYETHKGFHIPFYCFVFVLSSFHDALFNLAANSSVNNTGTEVETSTFSARMWLLVDI